MNRLRYRSLACHIWILHNSTIQWNFHDKVLYIPRHLQSVRPASLELGWAVLSGQLLQQHKPSLHNKHSHAVHGSGLSSPSSHKRTHLLFLISTITPGRWLLVWLWACFYQVTNSKSAQLFVRIYGCQFVGNSGTNLTGYRLSQRC
jgi:hypothetical protein